MGVLEYVNIVKHNNRYKKLNVIHKFIQHYRRT